MPTFRDAIRGLIPFGEHWTVSEIVDAIGRIHDAELAALRRKGDALVKAGADMDKNIADYTSREAWRAALAAWNAPAPECPTCPARAGGGKGRR